jgi:hypothetical protein
MTLVHYCVNNQATVINSKQLWQVSLYFCVAFREIFRPNPDLKKYSMYVLQDLNDHICTDLLLVLVPSLENELNLI